VTPGKALASRFARVLNAPQLLQASTDTTEPEELALGFFAFAADGFLAGALALVFFAITLLLMGFARVPAASGSHLKTCQRRTSEKARVPLLQPPALPHSES